MKKYKVLLVLLPFFINSCLENKKDSKRTKESNNFKTTQKATLAKKTVDYEVKVEKVDSLVTYLPPDNGHEFGFNEMQKEYNLDDTFEVKYQKLDHGYTYTKSATIAHRRIEFKNKYDTNGHIIKTLVQEFTNIQLEGGKSQKNSIQIFSRSTEKEMKKPKYEVVAYGNSLKLYEEEGYFLAREYGCCTTTPTFHLLNLKGNSVLKSNDIIKSIITEDNHYLISSLKGEVYDAPTIVIQDKNKGKQYVSFSNLGHEMNYAENYLIRLKDQNKPKTGFYDIPLAEYNLKSLDDLEIWIPFGEKDTLKIPFKNKKAFGVDFPQIKVTLEDKTS